MSANNLFLTPEACPELSMVLRSNDKPFKACAKHCAECFTWIILLAFAEALCCAELLWSSLVSVILWTRRPGPEELGDLCSVIKLRSGWTRVWNRDSWFQAFWFPALLRKLNRRHLCFTGSVRLEGYWEISNVKVSYWQWNFKSCKGLNISEEGIFEYYPGYPEMWPLIYQSFLFFNLPQHCWHWKQRAKATEMLWSEDLEEKIGA